MTLNTSKLQLEYWFLVVAAAIGLSVLGYGLYHQNQDIKNLQQDQAVQTDYLCERVASLAQRIATRTDPIRSLLRIEAGEATERGEMVQAARLNRLAKQVLVPEEVEC